MFAAIVCFVAITLLFLDFTGSLHAWLGWLAKIQFLPALLALNVGVVAVLVVLTLLFGRVYCSVICPLGVFQDIFSWMGGRGKKRRNRFRYSPAVSWLRYTVLALFVVLMVAGLASVARLVAPYSAYGRIASTLFAPLWQWGNNLAAYFAERAGSYAFYSVEVWMKGLGTLLVAAVTFLVLAVLAYRNGRTYCNTICPVGTVLGFLSRYSWLRPVIDTSKCNGCGLCARNCKASCIDPKTHEIDYSRCVACMDCLGKCNRGAISYTRRRAPKPAEAAAGRTAEVDASRRSFLSIAALLAASATVKAQQKKVDGGLAAIEAKKIPDRSCALVPAGAESLRHFTQHCTGCQLCVSVCPNQVLRPSTGIMTLMQPEMSYERGYCRPECTRCSEVCPTGAIERVTAAEKSSIQIGHAVWVRANCIPLTDGMACGNCARHCPTGAIRMVKADPEDSGSALIPAIDTERCIGCGACENLCPARPFSAIYVEGHPNHRII